jgi:hypothetical protein
MTVLLDAGLPPSGLGRENTEPFDDALQKGLGRAVLLAREAPRSAPLRASVMAACRHQQAYDPQCEGTRTTYLLELVDALDLRDEIRAQTLAALPTTVDDWDLPPLIGLANVFAREGDREAQRVLRAQLVEGPLSADVALAIVAIDGAAGLHDPKSGLLFAARIVGERATDGDEWMASEIVEEAHVLLGSEAVSACLAEGAARSPAIARFVELLEALRRAREKGAATPQPPPTLAELLAVAAAPPSRPRAGWPLATRWGRTASAGELTRAVDALVGEHDSAVQALLLRIFTRTKYPASPERLFELAHSPEAIVREQAVLALGLLEHPAIRAFAFERLGAAEPSWAALALFAHNASPGDGALVAKLLATGSAGSDADAVHARVGHVLAGRPEHLGVAEWRGPLEWVYEASPCSLCRGDAVEHLVPAGLLDVARTAEARFDCREEIRALVGGTADAHGTTPSSARAATSELGNGDR